MRNGKLLLEVAARPESLIQACGTLLMAERALGGAPHKAVLVLGGQSDSVLGIEVAAVPSPDAAADFIIKHS